MKQCSQCGYENADEIRHCRACGARLFRPAERPCPQCGLSNELGTRYCRGCGKMLAPSIAPQRHNSEFSRRVLGPNPRLPTSSNDPEMPEWMMRFRTPTPAPVASPPPQSKESVNLLLLILRRILGIAPDEISSIQIRKKDGETIELPTHVSEQVEARRKDKVRKW